MQYYYEYLIYPFILALLVCVGWITWKVTQSNWRIMPNKDPRWKNRNKIVDFCFAVGTIYITIIVVIMGGMTYK